MTGWGAPERLDRPDAVTGATQNSRIHNSENDHPRGCEACGQPFPDDRLDLSRFRGWSPKRFCSEACRKRAESARARKRRKENDLGN